MSIFCGQFEGKLYKLPLRLHDLRQDFHTKVLGLERQQAIPSLRGLETKYMAESCSCDCPLKPALRGIYIESAQPTPIDSALRMKIIEAAITALRKVVG